MKQGFGIDKDDKGVPSVPLYRVVPAASSEEWATERAYTCPIAMLRYRWVHEAMNTYSIAKEYPGIDIKDVVGAPSNQCIEAISIIGSAMASVESSLHNQEDK